MRLLFDTHAFLWWMGHDAKLSSRAFDEIGNTGNTVFVSVVNAWEIIIKTAQGKLQSPTDIAGAIQFYGFNLLEVTLPHVLALRDLPDFHKDPFDRMLIAQARVEQLTLITTDPDIQRYEVSVFDSRSHKQADSG